MHKYSEDDEIYLEYYLRDDDIKSYDAAAEFLGIPNQNLIKKACKMRAKGESWEYVNKPFTKREKEYIKKNYAMISTDLMKEHLGRTRDAIIAEANRLGLKKLKQLKYYDAEIRALAKAGYYKAEIARKLGLNPKSVGDYINRNNIPCKVAPKEASQKYFRDDEKIRHYTNKKASSGKEQIC